VERASHPAGHQAARSHPTRNQYKSEKFTAEFNNAVHKNTSDGTTQTGRRPSIQIARQAPLHPVALHSQSAQPHCTAEEKINQKERKKNQELIFLQQDRIMLAHFLCRVSPRMILAKPLPAVRSFSDQVLAATSSAVPRSQFSETKCDASERLYAAFATDTPDQRVGM
jgi:hypothetical protein